MMKKLASTAVSLFACSAVAMAQAAISFGAEECDFGIIPYNREAQATIEFTNTGTKPLKIDKVSTSCDCSVAEWPSTLIEPGKSSKITVTYDAKMMGHFYRELSVYCNAEPYMFTIPIVGEVSNTKADYTKTHPFKMGNVLLDAVEIVFNDVEIGKTYTRTIGVVNMGEEPYKPVLMHLPPYLSMTCEPEVLKHRQKGEITVTLNTNKLKGVGFMSTDIYLSRYPGDKISDETKIPVSAFVLLGNQGMSRYDMQNAPELLLSTTNWTLEDSNGKHSHTKIIEVGNSGNSVLRIERVQADNKIVSVKMKKKEIKPGESTKMKITLNMEHAGINDKTARIYLVTNDPDHPKEVITINI